MSLKQESTQVRPNSKVEEKHPSAFEATTLVLTIILSVIGAIIGLELITRVGSTPNTSIIGALFAIIIARIPIAAFKRYKDINRQSLVQTSISGATFSAANGLLMPIAIPFLMGRDDLILPMLFGAILAVITDASILYKCFDSKAFPATGAWPPGIATAESINAAAKGGESGKLLLGGFSIGAIGNYFGFPMDVLGIGWVANFWAMGTFSLGLLLRGYSVDLIGVNLNDYYIPHGFMIGAGSVAMYQIIKIILEARIKKANGEIETFTRNSVQVKKGILSGFSVFLGIALSLAMVTGLMTQMPIEQFILWLIFAGFAAIISELIVGIAAMHSGWFPGFATTLIFLVLGLLFGFPPAALAVLVGFTASTGPAFADMAYDLKAGWVLRGEGADQKFEQDGRRQQYFTEIMSFVVAAIVVIAVYKVYFTQGLVPPVSKVFVKTIEAGSNPEIALLLLIWAIPGALIQSIGGPNKQLGVLFSTGLLILNPIAGIFVAISLVIRKLYISKYGEEGQKKLYVVAAGLIAGSAISGFFSSTLKLGGK